MPVGDSAYIPLATVTLGTATASVTFSNIPNTYRDLIVVVNGSVSSGSSIYYRLNGDEGNNYFMVVSQAFSATSTAFQDTVMIPWAPNNLTANERFMITSQFMDYSATDKHKTALHRLNGVSGGNTFLAMSAARWGNTAAVTTLRVQANANLNIGSTLSLYGIVA
jgi:hypothetical protein